MKIFLKTGEVITSNEVTFKHNGAEAYAKIKIKSKTIDKDDVKMKLTDYYEVNTRHIEKIVGGKDTTNQDG